MNMTIDLEGVGAVLKQQLEHDLRAVVEVHVLQRIERDDIHEVTFQLVIDRCGTRFVRELFLVLRLGLWDTVAFQGMVRDFARTKIRQDLLKQFHKDLLSKAWSN